MSGYVSGGGNVVLYDASGNLLTSGTIANDSVANSQRAIDERAFNYLLANDGNWNRWATANRNDGLTGDNSGLVGITGYNDLTGWDKWRNNTRKLILASAVRATTTISSTQTNYNAHGVAINLDVTANPGGAETLTLELYPINHQGGTLSRIANLVAAAATNTRYSLYIYPGASGTIDSAANNKSVALVVPRLYFVQVSHSGAGNWTYSVDGYELV